MIPWRDGAAVGLICAAAVLILGGCASAGGTSAAVVERSGTPSGAMPMTLGNFSVSLNVKDLAASRAFYEKLGFRIVGGQQERRYLIMQNGTTTIGLFQGMIPSNILTFNPGWDHTCATVPGFTDIRDLQREMQARGLTLSTLAEPDSTGPASLTLSDPDGNMILLDQHVPKPVK
jgi:catechol 2,3-dioxygenase-like lactoylglutathione lyase family enzyme